MPAAETPPRQHDWRPQTPRVGPPRPMTARTPAPSSRSSSRPSSPRHRPCSPARSMLLRPTTPSSARRKSGSSGVWDEVFEKARTVRSRTPAARLRPQTAASVHSAEHSMMSSSSNASDEPAASHSAPLMRRGIRHPSGSRPSLLSSPDSHVDDISLEIWTRVVLARGGNTVDDTKMSKGDLLVASLQAWQELRQRAQATAVKIENLDRDLALAAPAARQVKPPRQAPAAASGAAMSTSWGRQAPPQLMMPPPPPLSSASTHAPARSGGGGGGGNQRPPTAATANTDHNGSSFCKENRHDNRVNRDAEESFNAGSFASRQAGSLANVRKSGESPASSPDCSPSSVRPPSDGISSPAGVHSSSGLGDALSTLTPKRPGRWWQARTALRLEGLKEDSGSEMHAFEVRRHALRRKSHDLLMPLPAALLLAAQQKSADGGDQSSG